MSHNATRRLLHTSLFGYVDIFNLLFIHAFMSRNRLNTCRDIGLRL